MHQLVAKEGALAAPPLGGVQQHQLGDDGRPDANQLLELFRLSVEGRAAMHRHHVAVLDPVQQRIADLPGALEVAFEDGGGLLAYVHVGVIGGGVFGVVL